MAKNHKLEHDEISMSRFISEYIGADVDCRNLYHRGLRSLESPLIIGVSNDICDKCPDLIATGVLLKVKDARGHLGTYINPQLIVDYAESVENREKYEQILKTLKIREFSKLNILYEQCCELEKAINKLDSYMGFIRMISKTDQEEVVKQKKIKRNADILRRNKVKK